MRKEMNLKLNSEVPSSNHIYMYLFLIGPLSGIAYMTEVVIIYELFTIIEVPCILAGGEGLRELSRNNGALWYSTCICDGIIMGSGFGHSMISHIHCTSLLYSGNFTAHY